MPLVLAHDGNIISNLKAQCGAINSLIFVKDNEDSEIFTMRLKLHHAPLILRAELIILCFRQ